MTEPHHPSRVLFVAATSRPCGPTSSLLLLIDELRRRFEPVVAVCEGGALVRELGLRGVPVIRLDGLAARHIMSVCRSIRSSGADIVYANTTSGATRNVFLATRFARLPFACHLRTMSGSQGWRKLFFLRFADAVIAVSNAAATGALCYVGNRPIRVVYNGIDTIGELPARDDCRADVVRELAIAGDSILILQASHVCHRKGQMYAVDALRRVRSQFPKAILVIAGALDRDEAYVGRLRDRISELNLRESVRLLGYRSDLPRMLAASDVFVHTALNDPHPRAVLEAMWAGKPVVAFDVDGVAETVVDGVTGRLTPPVDSDLLAEALIDLLNDPSSASQLGRAGHDRVLAHFSARVTAEKVGDVLDTLLTPRVRAGSQC